MLRNQKIVVIDGYNVLRNSARYADFVGQAPNFEDWTSEVWNAAREALLNDVLKTLDKNNRTIIVYDAAKREVASVKFERAHNFSSAFAGKNGTHNITKNCQVIFTSPGESADARIQKLVYASRQKGLEVQVVTSDLGIQDATMNKGVVCTSSREFVAAVADLESEVKQAAKYMVDNASYSQQTDTPMQATNPGASSKNSSKLTPKQAYAPMRAKIEDAVDAKTAAKLRQLRDSL